MGIRMPGALVYARTMLLFAALWAGIAAWKGNPILLPSPLAVLDAAVGLARDLELFEHAGVSLGRMIVSIALACVLAIPVGLAMGMSYAARRAAFIERTISHIPSSHRASLPEIPPGAVRPQRKATVA